MKFLLLPLVRSESQPLLIPRLFLHAGRTATVPSIRGFLRLAQQPVQLRFAEGSMDFAKGTRRTDERSRAMLVPFAGWVVLLDSGRR